MSCPIPSVGKYFKKITTYTFEYLMKLFEEKKTERNNMKNDSKLKDNKLNFAYFFVCLVNILKRPRRTHWNIQRNYSKKKEKVKGLII